MRFLRSSRGMTLLEVAVCVTILVMAGASLLAMVIGSVNGWSSGVSKDTMNSRATIAMQKLSSDIREARTATASEDEKTLSVTFPTLLTDPDTQEQSYHPSADDSVTRYYYVSDDGDLVREAGGDITVIGPQVSSADFGALGGTVTATLESSGQIGTAFSKQSVTGRISLRNFGN